MESSDEEDEDVKRAIALSLAKPDDAKYGDSTGQSKKADIEETPDVDRGIKISSQAPIGIAFAGFDRKAMEAERLQRLESRAPKRERSISPPTLGSRKAPRLDANTITLPSGARLTSFSTLVQHDQQARKSVPSHPFAEIKVENGGKVKHEARTANSNTHPSGPILYPKGVIKKTWCFGHPRAGNDIKLEELLEPATLRTAVLSAFQWDVEWVMSKLRVPPHGGHTKCVFVMQAKDESLRSQMTRETVDFRSFLRLCFPPMEGQVNCMHSKLMLLFHPDKLRVAVPSANLVQYDWGEQGTMENSVWIIDLPRLPDGRQMDVQELTPFGKELAYFVEKQGLDQDVRNGLLNFDWSGTLRNAFMHTVGGMSYGDDMQRNGLVGLARAVRDLGLQSDHELELDFASSSIGSLNDVFLQTVHAAARGEDLVSRAAASTAKKKSEFFSPSSSKVAGADTNIREKLRVYFPAADTVTSSKAGHAGTICLQRKWFEASTFPRESFRDYTSTRSGVLSHNKILYARGRHGGKNIAWAYVGSANLSESAWGKLVYERKEKAWKINARNWECGVLVPVLSDTLVGAKREGEVTIKKEEPADGQDAETESEDDGELAGAQDIVGMDVFDGVVDAPFEYPGRTYDGREPWYFTER